MKSDTYFIQAKGKRQSGSFQSYWINRSNSKFC